MIDVPHCDVLHIFCLSVCLMYVKLLNGFKVLIRTDYMMEIGFSWIKGYRFCFYANEPVYASIYPMAVGK